MNRQLIHYSKRILLFIAGQLILAFGVAFSIKSNLGVSPVSSVPYVFSRIFPQTIGFWTVIVYVFNMLLQIIILRRDYKLYNLLQIAVSFLFGYFTDLTIWTLSFIPVTDNLIVRSVWLLLGTSCVALGVFFYLTTSLIALPTDGTVQAVSKKYGFKLHHVKIWYDCISTAIALSLSLFVLRRIDGIGIGTVVAALGIGRMLGMFSSVLSKRVVRFLGSPGQPADPEQQ